MSIQEIGGSESSVLMTISSRNANSAVADWQSDAFIFVVIAHPILRAIWILVPTLRRQIEEIVGRIQQVNPALVRRIGVVDVAIFVAVKGADAFFFINFHF